MRIIKLKRLLINKNIPDLLNPAQRSNGIFSNASLDLPFAERKVLTDAISGKNLITFTRSSSGTFVNSQGVIQRATTNLLLQSNQFDTTWTNSNSSETTAAGMAPDGTNTAWSFTDTADVSAVAHELRQANIAGTSGLSYTYSVYAKAGTLPELILALPSAIFGASVATRFNLSNGSVTSAGGGVISSIVSVGGGWYRLISTATATASSTGTYILRLGNGSGGTYQGNGTGTVFIWGAQLEQSSTVGEYIPTGATINSAPRFDHNPTTGESLGLLVEEQRTNSFLQSQNFSATWTVNAATVGTAIAAPDGSTTAQKIEENNTTAEHRATQLSSGGATTGAVCFSVFAKAAERTKIRLAFSTLASWTGGGGAAVIFDLAAGTAATDSSTPTAFGINPYPNGWYRCFVVGTPTSSITPTGNIFLYTTANSYAGTTGSGAYLWGAQLEAGSFPTSYIPTTTSAVTRSADVASITGANFSSWYRQDEGTVFAEAQSLRSGGRIMMFDDGTTNNRWELRVTSGIPTLNSWSNNVQDGSASSGVNIGDPSAVFKSVGSIALNNAAISTNGATVGLDSSLALPIAINRFFIGSFQGTGTYANGTIRRLTFWPQRLPNSTLQEITR